MDNASICLVECVIQKRFLPIKCDGIVKLLRAEAATRTWCNLGKTSQSKWLNESPNRNLKKKYYVFEFFEWCLTSNLLYNYIIITQSTKKYFVVTTDQFCVKKKISISPLKCKVGGKDKCTMLYYTDTTSTSPKLYVELHEGKPLHTILKMSRKYSNAVVHRRKKTVLLEPNQFHIFLQTLLTTHRYVILGCKILARN